MPLVRYDIGNEYKLANPNLYTSASKDDPQGLLEGVAIAGLVGIVRQLGDLAVFASEVFHDLHEEVLATATRGHDLRNRIQQLETELPLIEKLILSHPNHVIFAYNPGVEWHANIQNDQSYLTHKDLPRFIRNSYEECRSPPRLFLLDKFDIAGAGACLKRYSDPSSFKIQWAHTEIRKAEKEQRDKKNRRIQKKIERKEKDEVQNASPNLERMSHKITEGDTITSSNLHPLIVDSGVSKEDVASIMQLNHQTNPLREPIISKQEGFALESHSYGSRFERFGANVPGKDLQSNVPSFKSSQFVSISSSFGSGRMEITDSVGYIGQVENKHPNVNMKKITEDDGASETDNFMDAMTTIESEIETDSEMRSMVRAHREVPSESRISKRTNVQSSEVNRLFPASEIEKNSVEGSISESSERSNPRSSEFVFGPMMRSHNDILDTDEDTNGIHVLPISSSSSSALSSPRPSTLATTVFNMHLRSGTEYHPSLERSDSSSLRHSSRSSSPDINLVSNRGSYKEDLDLDSFSLSHLQSPKRSGRFSSESSGSSSPDITPSSKRDGYKEELGSLRFPLNHGAFIKEMEDFPPPPPLPPLEWLMSKRVDVKSVSSPTAMDPSLKISISTNVLSKTNQSILESKSCPTGLESIDNIPPTSDGHAEASATRELSSNSQQSHAYAVARVSHEISEVLDGASTEHTLERSTGSIDISNSKDENFTSPSHGKNTSPSLPKNDIGSMEVEKPSLSKNDIESRRVIPQTPNATLLSTSGKDLAIEEIATHGRNTLKKHPERSQSSRIATSDDRESMLEQIRTRSFNLRHTKTEKHDRLNSVVSNINVAAILEKANAIRQATGPNDDDYNDAWSDT